MVLEIFGHWIGHDTSNSSFTIWETNEIENVVDIPSTAKLQAFKYDSRSEGWDYRYHINDINVSGALIDAGVITEEMLEEARNQHLLNVKNRKKSVDDAERKKYEELKAKYETDW